MLNAFKSASLYQKTSLVMAIPGLALSGMGFFHTASWNGNENITDYVELGIICTISATFGYSVAYVTWPVLYPVIVYDILKK